jgi:gliding motility-associated-like protein
MKQLTLFLLLGWMCIQTTVHSQCGIRLVFGSIVPTSSWQTINWGRGGEGQVFNADSGCVYQFSYCVTDGGYAPFDTQITIFDEVTQLFAGGYNDDFAGCGTGSKITWTAPRTGPFRLQTDKKPCTTDTRLVTLAFRRLSCPPPSCTYAQTDICIFDATGGLGNCLFVGDLCSDGFQFGGMVRNSSPFQLNELQVLDSIRFRIYTSGCPPGASQGFFFYLNNQLIGTLTLGSNDCLCAAVDYPRTVVFSGNAIRTAWNPCGANVLGVSANNDPNYAISGYAARLFYTNKPPAPPVITLSIQICGPNSLSVPAAPCGKTYYWQPTICDTLRSFPASVPYTALVPGVYRVRTENSALPGCWSDSCSAQEVYAPIQGNVLLINQTICSGSLPVQLSGSALSGGFGTYIYSWESSPDSLNWASVPGETLSEYQPPIPSLLTWYRRWVVAGCSTVSPGIKIVPEDSIQGNIIGSNQTICALSLPGLFTGTLPSGGTLNFTWEWQESTDSLNWILSPGGSTQDFQAPLLTVPHWFRRKVSAGVCPPDTSPPVYVFLELPIGNISLNSFQTLCVGDQPQLLSGSTPSGGIGTYLYQWESAPDGISWSQLIGSTNQDYFPSIPSASLYFRRIVQSGLCPANTSDSLLILLEPPIGNNQISANQSLCETVIGQPLSGTLPSGGIGIYTYGWETSPDGTLWAAAGYTSPGIPVTGQGFRVWYRRVVNSGVCPGDTSNVIEVFSYPAIQNNILGPDQTICLGTSPGVLGTTVPSGGNGLFGYQWESALSISGWQTIVGATQLTYIAPTLTQSVYFRRIVSAAFCTDTSQAQYWQVVLGVSPNVIGADQTVCGSGQASQLNGPMPSGGGALSYQWQQSIDNSSWSDISGGSQVFFTPSALNQTTWFRRIVFSALCLPLTTQSIRITQLQAPTGNQIGSSQTICFNSLPSMLTGTQPSGGYGIYYYYWEQSPDLNVWSIPSGAVFASYQPGLLSGTAYFRRTVLTQFCSPFTSNIIQIDLEQALGNNQIGVSQTICAGGVFQPITGTVPSGGNGNYSFVWQSSLNLGTWSFAGNQANLPSTVLSQPTWLRRVVNGGACRGDTSGYISVFVQALITNNTIGNHQTICETQTPAILTGSVPSGGDGLYFYQWESSIDNFNWLHLPGTFQQDYQAPQVLQSVYYRRLAYSGLCPSSTSTAVYIRTDRLIGGNVISSDQTICAGNLALPFSGTMPTGGTFSFQYQWQTSLTGITWAQAAIGSTLATYTPGIPNQSLFYRRLVSSGVCSTNSSNTIRIEVLPVLSNNVIQGSQTLCSLDAPQLFTGSLPGGADGNFVYQWEISLDGITWNPAGGLDQLRDYQASLPTGNSYYRRRVHNSFCSSSTSNILQMRSDAPVIQNSFGPDQLLCFGTAPLILSSLPPQGGNGIYQFTWESSTDSIQWAFADTTEFYTPLTLSFTAFYRRIVQSGVCSPDTGNTVTVGVELPIGNNQIASSQTLCLGMPAAILRGSIPTGGNGHYFYYWESSLDGSTWVPGGNQVDFDPGTVQQTILVRRRVSSGVCLDTVSNQLTIQIHPLPFNNEIGTAQTICGGQVPAQLTGSIPQGGGGIYAFEWQSATGSVWHPIPGGFQQHFQPPALFVPTRFRRIVTSGPCAPDISEVVFIQVLPKPSITLDSDTLCVGEQITLTAWVSLPGGTFLWFPGNETTQSILVSPSVTTGYSVQYEVNGCQAIPVGATVTVNPLPPAIITWPVSDIICVGGSKVLTVNSQGGPYTYLWNTGASTQTILASQPGKYSVTVQNAFGCKQTSFVDIRYANPPLSVTAPPVPGVCPDRSQQRINVIPTGGVPPYTVVWSPRTGLSSTTELSPLATVTGPRTYTALVTDNIGCTGQASVSVGINPGVQARFAIENLKGDTLYFPQWVSLVNTSQNALDCVWDLWGENESQLCNPPDYQLLTEGLYAIRLSVTSPEGCRDSTRKNFWFRTDPTLSYPTAFSPNGDGLNDFFRIPNMNVQSINIFIYDRWGNVIFTSQDPEFTWDGMMNGNPVMEGIYILQVKGLGMHGQPIEYQGTITVIR